MTLKTSILTDLDNNFLNPDEFGDAVTYHNRDSKEKTINGIFDDEFTQVNPVTGAVETTKPQIQVKSSDVADAVVAVETITRNGTTYYIIDILPDGTGMTILILSEHAI
jgi:hypothetical protein